MVKLCKGYTSSSRANACDQNGLRFISLESYDHCPSFAYFLVCRNGFHAPAFELHFLDVLFHVTIQQFVIGARAEMTNVPSFQLIHISNDQSWLLFV
jgi:hypothetical protein